MTLCRSRRRQVLEMHCCHSFCWAHNPKVGGSNPPPATNSPNHSNHLAFHPKSIGVQLGPKTQAFPAPLTRACGDVNSSPKRAAIFLPSSETTCVYFIVVRGSE